MEHLMLLENPALSGAAWHKAHGKKRGRKRGSSGTSLAGVKLPSMKDPLMGIKPIEIIAAVGGLAAATMVPSMLVKDTSTTTKKILKVASSFIIAVAVGGIAKGFIGSEAARAATFGGIAGAGAQTLGTFTTFKIGGGNIGLPVGRISTSELVSPSRNREGENVAIIQP